MSGTSGGASLRNGPDGVLPIGMRSESGAGSAAPLLVNIQGQPGMYPLTTSLPAGAATASFQTNVQSAAGTSATTAITIQGSTSGVAIPVSGPLTNAQLTTAGLATAAKQDTGNTTLAAIETKLPLPQVGSVNNATPRVTVGTTAIALLAARAGGYGVGRIGAVIVNAGPATVYIGNSAAVTIANGFPLPMGASLKVTAQTGFWAISSAAGNAVSIYEEW